MVSVVLWSGVRGARHVGGYCFGDGECLVWDGEGGEWVKGFGYWGEGGMGGIS